MQTQQSHSFCNLSPLVRLRYLNNPGNSAFYQYEWKEALYASWYLYLIQQGVGGTPVSSSNAWVGVLLFYPKGDMNVTYVWSNRGGYLCLV